MKFRFAPLLLLILLVASTASWADTVLVGSLDLFNNGPVDSLMLTNTTGQGSSAPSNTVPDALTFSNLSLTINGSAVSFDTTQEPVAANGGVLDFGDLFAPNSIRSLSLTGSWNGSPSLALLPGIFATYSGPTALADGGHIDVYANTQSVSAPEPAVLSLFGFAFCFLGRRRITR